METSERGMNQSEKAKRPNSWDIEEKFAMYKRAQDESEGGGDYMVDEIKTYIDGEGEVEIREQFYPNWTKEDFETLLELIENE